MEKKKLNLDKIIVGSLSSSELKTLIGGYDASLFVNKKTHCVPPTAKPTYERTSLLYTCPVTTPPPAYCSTVGPLVTCSH